MKGEVTVVETKPISSSPQTEEPTYIKLDFYDMLNYREKKEIELGVDKEEEEVRRRIDEDVARMLQGPGRKLFPYSDEVAAKICALTAAGLPLKKVCEFPGLPSQSTVWSWTLKNPKFAEAFEMARYHRCHALAEEAINIADNTENDVHPNGKPNWSAVQRDKLRIDTRHWIISKLCPSRYGQKVDNSSTQNIAPVINVQIASIDG